MLGSILLGAGAVVALSLPKGPAILLGVGARIALSLPEGAAILLGAGAGIALGSESASVLDSASSSPSSKPISTICCCRVST